jgi:hypothetical protein
MHVLKDDDIELLRTINNEAKVRRSTKSLVLGTAKVMSYEDLELARAKRVAKDSAQAAKGKGKRGRKSKNSPPEQEDDTAETASRGRKRKSAEPAVPEPTNKMARTSNAPKALVIQASRTQIAEDEIEPKSWTAPVAPVAPVARMYLQKGLPCDVLMSSIDIMIFVRGELRLDLRLVTIQ